MWAVTITITKIVVAVRDRGAAATVSPYGHLEPISSAELSWEARPATALRRLWYAHLRDPLHVDRLLTVFDFPPTIRLGRGRDGLPFVIDESALVEIAAGRRLVRIDRAASCRARWSMGRILGR